MGISIEGDVSSKLGLASHQNAVPLLRQLKIANDGTEGLEDLVLELETSLPFASPKSWRIDRLAPNSSIAIPDRDVELREGYLADLTESMRASIHLRLRSGTGILAEQRFPVELLARNQWGGAGSMPELLAAFCMPNDPAVDKVLKSTSDVLRRAGRTDGIDGYGAGSRKRVWELTSAVWSAVCGYQVSYVLPPASFEQEGQKIRSPSQVLDGHVGTCLDTALLFAAALEQAGLNPVLLMTKGHAFAGVWLQPQEFSQVLNEDASSVRKRIELQELLVFETTLATQSPAPGFSHAVDVAKRQLTDDDFVMAVDLRRARMQKVRPLTVTASVYSSWRNGTSIFSLTQSQSMDISCGWLLTILSAGILTEYRSERRTFAPSKSWHPRKFSRCLDRSGQRMLSSKLRGLSVSAGFRPRPEGASPRCSTQLVSARSRTSPQKEAD